MPADRRLEAEESRGGTAEGTGGGSQKKQRSTAGKKAATRARKTTSGGTGTTGGTARKRGTGSTATKRAGAAKKTGTRKRSTGTRSAASSTTTAVRKTGGGQKTPTRTQGNGAGGRTATRPATRERRTLTERAPVGDLMERTARDYNEAKKALSTLWKDAAKTTYSAFNTIAANVEKRFEESRKVISEIDVRYALDKSQEKLKQVGQSTTDTAQAMGRQVKLLYQMLKDSTAGRFKAPWVTVSAITAALLYFISPIDVLPDFIPGAGLIDDALVISLCISVIRMDLKRYAKEMNLDLADYALAKK